MLTYFSCSFFLYFSAVELIAPDKANWVYKGEMNFSRHSRTIKRSLFLRSPIGNYFPDKQSFRAAGWTARKSADRFRCLTLRALVKLFRSKFYKFNCILYDARVDSERSDGRAEGSECVSGSAGEVKIT